MKKFICKIAIYISVILLLAIAVDAFISKRLRTNESRMYASWNAIYNDTTDYDLVISGSSRAWIHYHPLILDSILGVNSFNLGMNGSAINRQIIKYNKYTELHVAPKYLIQNIDYGTIDITYGYERQQTFPYLFYDRNLLNAFDAYENYSFAEKWIPAARYIGYTRMIKDAILNSRYDCLTKGYRGADKTWEGANLAHVDSVVCSDTLVALNMFVDFLDQVTKQGTQVLFVYAPVYSTLRTKMVNEQQMYEMYDSIAQRFNIPILDYNNHPICLDTVYFYNRTHLNRLGAELFTTQLAHDIDSIGFLPNSTLHPEDTRRSPEDSSYIIKEYFK